MSAGAWLLLAALLLSAAVDNYMTRRNVRILQERLEATWDLWKVERDLAVADAKQAALQVYSRHGETLERMLHVVAVKVGSHPDTPTEGPST